MRPPATTSVSLFLFLRLQCARNTKGDDDNGVNIPAKSSHMFCDTVQLYWIQPDISNVATNKTRKQSVDSRVK